MARLIDKRWPVEKGGPPGPIAAFIWPVLAGAWVAYRGYLFLERKADAVIHKFEDHYTKYERIKRKMEEEKSNK
jgi:hypothetical protein